MSHKFDPEPFDPQSFSGQVRLFPLPNLVLFPQVLQPLHIFEQRYVEMLKATLAGDQMFAMALLEPGWEQDYEGRPPIAPVACLARVVTWQAAPNDRYNLLAVGLQRVRVTQEMPATRTYREADVELLEDEYPAASAANCKSLHTQLSQALAGMLPHIENAQELFGALSLESTSLGTLCDVISYAIDVNVATKQWLLSQQNVERRALRLLTELKSAAEDHRPPAPTTDFPPQFSTN